MGFDEDEGWGLLGLDENGGWGPIGLRKKMEVVLSLMCVMVPAFPFGSPTKTHR